MLLDQAQGSGRGDVRGPRTRQRVAGAAVLVIGLLLAACSSAAQSQQAGRGAVTISPSARRAAGDIHRENQRPGTPAWRLRQVGSAHAIEGWTDRTSALPGQRVGLHVSTAAAAYTVNAIRVGWYRGALGRQVWASPRMAGVRRHRPRVVGPTHTVVTDWPVSLYLPTADWPPGDYLLRLDASSGAQRYVPLQLRQASAAARLVIVSADATWQAYNAYGGYSLYHGPDGTTASRARAVSFDRPYGTQTGQGASEYMENMRPLVSLVEQLDLPVDYVSDIDLDLDPHLLDGASGVVFTGHDEYWSAAMRQALLGARGRGTNLAFLGANSGYRHIRLRSSRGGADRVEVCYKVPAEDPLARTDPADATGQWRYPPDPRPESVLTGAYYESNPVQADLVVVDPHAWLLVGTGTRTGSVLPAVVAPEYDRVDLSVPTPRPMEILTHSPLTVGRRRDFADSAYYTVPSGAGGFDAGSIAWINSLQGASGAASARFTTRVTTTLLTAFAAGPAGWAQPASDNVAAVYPSRRRR